MTHCTVLAETTALVLPPAVATQWLSVVGSCSSTCWAGATLAAEAPAVPGSLPAPTVAERWLAEGRPSRLAGWAEATVLQRDERLAIRGGLVGGQLEEGGVGAEVGLGSDVNEGIHLRRQ